MKYATILLVLTLFTVKNFATKTTPCQYNLLGQTGKVIFPKVRRRTPLPAFATADNNATTECVYFKNLAGKTIRLEFRDIMLNGTELRVKTSKRSAKSPWKTFRTISKNLPQKVVLVRGVKSVKIVVQKKAESFIMGFSVEKPLTPECKNMQKNVVATTCTKAQKVGSKCSFTCTEGFEINELVDQSSAPNFAVTCRKSGRKSASWQPSLNKFLCKTGRKIKKKCRTKLQFCVPVIEAAPAMINDNKQISTVSVTTRMATTSSTTTTSSSTTTKPTTTPTTANMPKTTSTTTIATTPATTSSSTTTNPTTPTATTTHKTTSTTTPTTTSSSTTTTPTTTSATTPPTASSSTTTSPTTTSRTTTPSTTSSSTTTTSTTTSATTPTTTSTTTTTTPSTTSSSTTTTPTTTSTTPTTKSATTPTTTILSTTTMPTTTSTTTPTTSSSTTNPTTHTTTLPPKRGHTNSIIIMSPPLTLKHCSRFCKMSVETLQFAKPCGKYKALAKKKYCMICRYSTARPCKKYAHFV